MGETQKLNFFSEDFFVEKQRSLQKTQSMALPNATGPQLLDFAANGLMDSSSGMLQRAQMDE